MPERNIIRRPEPPKPYPYPDPLPLPDPPWPDDPNFESIPTVQDPKFQAAVERFEI